VRTCGEAEECVKSHRCHFSSETRVTPVRRCKQEKVHGTWWLMRVGEMSVRFGVAGGLGVLFCDSVSINVTGESGGADSCALADMVGGGE